MREELKEVLDKGGFGRVFLADLSRCLLASSTAFLFLNLHLMGLTLCQKILFLARFLTDFMELNQSTQHYLLAIVEKWKEVQDKVGFGRVLLADLPKAFACLKHVLLILKLASYRFATQSLNFVFKEMSQINNAYSNYLISQAQVSILGGHLLFNIYIFDVFLEEYECDSTPVLYT